MRKLVLLSLLLSFNPSAFAVDCDCYYNQVNNGWMLMEVYKSEELVSEEFFQPWKTSEEMNQLCFDELEEASTAFNCEHGAIVKGPKE